MKQAWSGKPTMWDDVGEYRVVGVYISATTGEPVSITLQEASGKPRTFVKSRKGNWFWRATRTADDYYADGKIVRDGASLEKRAMSEGRHYIVSADGTFVVPE